MLWPQSFLYAAFGLKIARSSEVLQDRMLLCSVIFTLTRSICALNFPRLWLNFGQRVACIEMFSFVSALVVFEIRIVLSKVVPANLAFELLCLSINSVKYFYCKFGIKPVSGLSVRGFSLTVQPFKLFFSCCLKAAAKNFPFRSRSFFRSNGYPYSVLSP